MFFLDELNYTKTGEKLTTAFRRCGIAMATDHSPVN